MASDPAAARRAFFDEVHRPLHELAAEAAGADRAAAARLHEAKAAFERELNGERTLLRANLDRLIDAAEQAIRATGHPPLERCT